MINNSNVITIPQIGSTCWFTALLMSIFYSKHSRILIKRRIKSLSKSNPLHDVYKLFTSIYAVSSSKRNDVNRILNKYSSVYILSNLHKYDNLKFNFNPSVLDGYIGYEYLINLYELLGFKNILPLDRIGDKLHASIVPSFTYEDAGDYYKIRFYDNTSFDLEKFKSTTYDILIMYDISYIKKSSNPVVKKNFTSDSLKVNGADYVLDSIIIPNFNADLCDKSHTIAGITCGDKRYIYNGWITIIDDDPGYSCKLIEYDWLNETGDFCLHHSTCTLYKPNRDDLKKQLCFNSHKHNRMYVYVRRSVKNKKCIEPYVLDPVSKRCVKELPKKKCIEPYVLDPVTKRCTKNKSKN